MAKTKNYLMFLIALMVAVLAGVAYGKDEKLSAGGYLNSAFGFNYNANERKWAIVYPIHGLVYVAYKKGIMKVVGGLRYNGEIGIGDLYIIGGEGESYMKLGNYKNDWDISKSINSLMTLSERDDSYPNNLFYIKKYNPNPAFNMVISRGNFLQELIISQKENSTEINRNIIGFKSSVKNENNTLTLGVIRRIGFPPPNYFLQLWNSSENIRWWLQLGWIYWKDKRDEWSGALGVEKKIDKNDVSLELVLDQDQNLFYTESNTYIRNNIVFNLISYLSLNDWSSAWNIGFIFIVNKNFNMELGSSLFLGKNGKYFSPEEEAMDNNDNIYLKLGIRY